MRGRWSALVLVAGAATLLAGCGIRVSTEPSAAPRHAPATTAPTVPALAATAPTAPASAAPGIAALVAKELRHRLTIFAAVIFRVRSQQMLEELSGEHHGFALGLGSAITHMAPPACAALAGLPISRFRRATSAISV